MLTAIWLLGATLLGPTPMPYYYNRPITSADLDGKTLGELNVIRNTIYARAGNVFRKKWLKDYFAAQGWYRPRKGGIDNSLLSALDNKNAEAVIDYELAIPGEELRKRLASLEHDEGALASPVPRDIEVALLNEELGIANPASTSPLENPPLLDQLVSVKQLADFSPRELRLLRNMIYARRGRVFTSKDLGNYFRRTDWYHPDPTFTETRLSRNDEKNIRIVQSVEDEARESGFGDRKVRERFMMGG